MKFAGVDNGLFLLLYVFLNVIILGSSCIIKGRYPRYFKQDPETILRSIIVYSSRSEDDSILEGTLERFRAFDKQQKNQAIDY